MKQTELILILRQIHFTPTERRILTLLSNGRRYDMETVRQAAYPGDDQAGNGNLANHISSIRTKVRELQHTILSEYEKGITYYQYIVFETIVANSDIIRGRGEAV